MTVQPRNIAHLDLDCFFVSVERIRDPSLEGKPVVVGGSPKGRGVVASASYEARAFGIRSAMPMARALRLCPNLTVVGGHYSNYGDYSRRLAKRLEELAPVIERASIDEMYLDLTGCERLYGDLAEFVHKLQRMVWEEFHLPATVSLASNKLVAKVAAGVAKPNGVRVVAHGTEREFLGPLPIAVIPGIGKKTEAVLHDRGFRIVADLQKVAQETMVKMLGKHGLWISRAANGYGSETVHPDRGRKSISQEETFSHDLSDRRELERILRSLTEGVCSTLRAGHEKARTITVKIRYADFRTITRGETVRPTDDDAEVSRVVQELLRTGYSGDKPLRLLGVRLSNLLNDMQMELELLPSGQKRRHVLDAMDGLRDKFGNDIIHLGTSE